MTPQEYNNQNIRRESDLIKETWNNPPQNQTEKDIFNLKYMLYGIMYGSILYRTGCVSTLKRAIKRLEGNALEKTEETQTP